MVKLQQYTIYKGEITEIVNELLDDSNDELVDFLQQHIHYLNCNLDRALTESVKGNDADLAGILLEVGANSANREDSTFYTPLHLATCANDREMINVLLNHGAEIEVTTNDDQSTALHLAARKGHKRAMKVLLERGANVNAKNESDRTPLHEAAIEGNKPEAQLLIKYGADVTALSDGKTPADYAESNGHHSVAGWLMKMQSRGLEDEAETKRKTIQFLKRLLKPEKMDVIHFLQSNISNIQVDLNASLISSVRNGQEILTEILLDHGADTSTQNSGTEDVYTSLQWAALLGHTEVAKCLLDHGADIEDKKNNSEETALHIAAQQCSMGVLKLLLDKGANVDARDKSNETALHKAAIYGYRDVAQLLIRYGADVKAVSDDDKTAADHAVIHDHNILAKWLNWQMDVTQDKTKDVTNETSTKNKIKEFVKNLLEPSNIMIFEFLEENLRSIAENIDEALVNFAMDNKVLALKIVHDLGADISTRYLDYTPLLWAASNGHPEIVKLLLDRGANVEDESLDNQAKPLHLAASGGEKEVLKLLLERGANVNSRMKSNRTPLHEASDSNVAELLIKHGADVEAESDDGMPLHVAVSEGKAEVVELLLKKGANVNARNTVNRTPLHEAAGSGNHACAELLIKYGADIEAKSYVGTPADFAGVSGHFMIEKWLRQIAELNRENSRNKRVDFSHFAANNEDYAEKLKEVLKEIMKPSNIEIFDFFESHMALYGSSTCNVNTLLQRCVTDGNITGVEIMHDLGADANTKENSGESTCTPLYWASHYGHTEIAKFLLDHGADIEQKVSYDEETALQIAASKGHSETLKLLLERGANVNVSDLSNKTAIHKAASEGNELEVEMLVKYGADIKAVSDEGTPEDCARRYGHHDLADWLKSL